MKYLLRALLILALSLTSVNSFAQAGGATEDPLVADTMKNIWIVSGVAAAGAVLGLSTLSFVDEPSENLKNIVTGAAIGVIIGVGVVAYMQATRSKEMYEYGYHLGPEFQKDFSTVSRNGWHQQNFNSYKPNTTNAFQFNTTF